MIKITDDFEALMTRNIKATFVVFGTMLVMAMIWQVLTPFIREILEGTWVFFIKFPQHNIMGM